LRSKKPNHLFKMKNLFTITGLTLFAALNFGNVKSSNANAFQQTQNEVAPSGYLNLTSMCSNDPAATRRWRVRNYTNAPVNFTWDVYNAGQNGSGVAQPGDSFFETVTVAGSPNTTRIFWTVEGTSYQKVKASGGAQCDTPPPVVPCGTNLIVNGDFEGGNASFTSGYTYKVDGAANNELVPENSYAVGQNIATYHPQLVGTGRSGNFLMVNGNTLTALTVWSQNVNVVAGKSYTFKAYAQNTFAASPAVLRVYAGAELLGTFSPEGLASWTEFTSTFTASSTGSIELKVVDSNLSKTGNDFGMDDLSLIEVCPELPASCYAEEVVSFNQQKRNDGSTIDAIRSNPAKALGAPEANDTENFVALGFGGDITLKFGSPIKNGDGNDVRVVESTFGNIGCNRYPETIRAFASQDGCNFVFIGEGCQDTDFDLGMLAWAQYIKLVDVSPVGAPYQGTPVADAYDVDGVMCLNGYEANPVLEPAAVGANEVVSYNAGLRKNGTAIPAARANAANALGVPEGTNAVNFVALGFGGSIVLKFKYVIFDNPSANDLQVVETSYGNPSCASYPETAEIEGSLDGVNWVSLGTICQDGEVDITSAGTIQYVRITDRSAFSSFSGSADAYDVDGVVIINNACGTSSSTTARWSDNTTTADEITSAEVYPNPFSDNLNLAISTGDQDNFATVTVTNYIGKLISSERLNVTASSSIQHALNVSNLSKGVYLISVETNSTKEVLKVVKQ
jgi:hypothetical protein